MFSFLKYFIKLEAAGGLVLIAAAVAAMLMANSPFATAYAGFAQATAHSINDGLMVLFFLVVGIEIKRECLQGELSTRAKAVLPLGGALGGVLAPALIYSWFNIGTPQLHGWAIPAATDIAFALGVLSLFGKRVPVALKIFLMALAVIDDLAAIIIIALFYTGNLAFAPLVTALGLCALLVLLARRGVRSLWPYIALGLVLWLCVLSSGVHATIAGVLLGVLMPSSAGEKLLHKLHAPVAFAIVPLFAFVNSGVPLSGLSLEHVANPVTLGIALGLFIGKPLGIFAACLLLIGCKLATLPKDVRYGQLFATSSIAGIGFTMSLFIGMLALPGAESQNYIRLGVLGGSLASAMIGGAMLHLFTKKVPR